MPSCAFDVCAHDRTCKSPGTHRVHYCVDPETTMIPDHRLYCLRHAEQYAGVLRGMACITAVEVRQEEKTCAR